MGYRKYTKDYKVRLVSANDGRRMKEEYVYVGDWFVSGLPEDKEKNFGRISAVLSVLSAAAFVAAGMIDCNAMRSFYAALPFAVTLLPLGFSVAGAWGVLRGNGKMKREAFDHSWRRLKSMSLATMILSLITVIGGIVFVVFARDFSGTEVSFLVLMAVVGAVSFINYSRIRKNCSFHAVEAVEKPKS